MGACSSKPKTTEFEGSMAPSKQTEEVAADQPQAIERSLEIPVDEHGKEVSAKDGDTKAGEGGGDTHATTKAVQTERELDAAKEEGPLANSTGSNLELLGEKEAVKAKASYEVEPKEESGDGAADEVVQKADVGSSVVYNPSADDKRDVDSTVVDNPSGNEKGFEDKVDRIVDDVTKTCEDKVVVLEEAASSQGDAPYVDKAVPLNEEKPAETETATAMAMETPDKRSIVVPEEEVSGALDPTESPGVESPIVGIIKPVEPPKEDDLSKSIDAEPEKDSVDVRMDADNDSNLVDEHLPTDARDGHVSVKAVDAEADVDTSITSDPQMDVKEPAGEVSSEGIEATGVEMPAPAEGDSLKDFEEATRQLQKEVASDEIDCVIPATADSQVAVEECPRNTELSVPLDVNAVHADSPKDGGSVDDTEVEAPKKTESTDSGASSIKPKSDDIAEKSVEEVDGPTVQETDVSNVQTLVLAPEESVEDSKPKDTSDENASESAKKSEEEPVITNEPGKDSIGKLQVEHTTSGDVTFEDASDVPLKLEASKSMEEGQVPS